MSIDSPTAAAGGLAQTTGSAEPATSVWIETAVAVGFAASAVFFVSLVAVMSGLV